MSDKRQMKIRLDDFGGSKLREMIEQEAVNNNVSMNSVIVSRLQASFMSDTGLMSEFGRDLLLLAMQTEIEARAKARKKENEHET